MPQPGALRVPKSQSLCLGPTVINVWVGTGPNLTKFVVHEALICRHSKFFEVCMNGQWKEAEERLVKLPEDEPHIFSIYMEFLYTCHFVCEHIGPKEEDYEDKILGKLYVLAEKLMDDEAKKRVIDAFIMKNKVWRPGSSYSAPSMDIIRFIYERTTGPCGIRRLFMDFIVGKTYKDDVLKWWSQCPTDLREDIITALYAEGRIKLKDSSSYYD